MGKVIAGLVMGIVAAALTSLVASVALASGEDLDKAEMWAPLAGFALMLVLALTAARDRYAWGRGLLLCGILSLAAPMVAIVIVEREAVDVGQLAAIGPGLAGTVLGGTSSIVSILLGLIFLIGSYFTLRKA